MTVTTVPMKTNGRPVVGIDVSHVILESHSFEIAQATDIFIPNYVEGAQEGIRSLAQEFKVILFAEGDPKLFRDIHERLVKDAVIHDRHTNPRFHMGDCMLRKNICRAFNVTYYVSHHYPVLSQLPLRRGLAFRTREHEMHLAGSACTQYDAVDSWTDILERIISRRLVAV